MLGFVGITDVTLVHAEGLALSPEARGPAIARAKTEIDALPLTARAEYQTLELA